MLRALKIVTNAAHKAGIYGKLGADLTLLETFLAIRFEGLSVSPFSVLPYGLKSVRLSPKPACRRSRSAEHMHFCAAKFIISTIRDCSHVEQSLIHYKRNEMAIT